MMLPTVCEAISLWIEELKINSSIQHATVDNSPFGVPWIKQSIFEEKIFKAGTDFQKLQNWPILEGILDIANTGRMMI